MKKTIKIGIWKAKLDMVKDFQGHILAQITMPKAYFENQKKIDKWVKDYYTSTPKRSEKGKMYE